jgi:uncharacterized membrane protein
MKPYCTAIFLLSTLVSATAVSAESEQKYDLTLGAQVTKEKCFGLPLVASKDCDTANNKERCLRGESNEKDFKFVDKNSCEKLGGRKFHRPEASSVQINNP